MFRFGGISERPSSPPTRRWDSAAVTSTDLDEPPISRHLFSKTFLQRKEEEVKING